MEIINESLIAKSLTCGRVIESYAAKQDAFLVVFELLVEIGAPTKQSRCQVLILHSHILRWQNIWVDGGNFHNIDTSTIHEFGNCDPGVAGWHDVPVVKYFCQVELHEVDQTLNIAQTGVGGVLEEVALVHPVVVDKQGTVAHAVFEHNPKFFPHFLPEDARVLAQREGDKSGQKGSILNNDHGWNLGVEGILTCDQENCSIVVDERGHLGEVHAQINTCIDFTFLEVGRALNIALCPPSITVNVQQLGAWNGGEDKTVQFINTDKIEIIVELMHIGFICPFVSTQQNNVKIGIIQQV